MPSSAVAADLVTPFSGGLSDSPNGSDGGGAGGLAELEASALDDSPIGMVGVCVSLPCRGGGFGGVRDGGGSSANETKRGGFGGVRAGGAGGDAGPEGGAYPGGGGVGGVSAAMGHGSQQDRLNSQKPVPGDPA